MVDVDNVLLLRPADGGPRLEHDPASARRSALRSVTGCSGRDDLRRSADVAGDPLARFVTEHGKNDFPALPVREDVDVVVCLWASEPPSRPAGRQETLRLRPTPRSLLP